MAGAPPDSKINILLVDDRPENLLALEAILDSPHYHLVKAHDGEEALKRVLREDFALILLDVVMPRMDGFEVAALIKRREKTRHIPIIFLTGASTGPDPEKRAYSIGAVDYLEKPVDPSVVKAKVESFVGLFRKGEEIKRQAEVLYEGERLERERAVSAVKEAGEKRYRNLAEAIPQIVWTAAPDGSIDYLNERFCDYAGIALADAKGWGWMEALHPEDVHGYLDRWREAVAGRTTFQAECRLRRAADGAYRWHLTRALPERANGPEILAWLGTSTDIEDQKSAQAKLADAHARAEALYREAKQAVAARDEFLSIASHELKTPLTAMKLYLSGLLRTVQGPPCEPLTPERVRGKLEATARQVDRLVKLMNELLDVSRISGGQLALERERVDLTEIAREAVARFEAEIARARATVNVRADGPVVGEWDAFRIDQVVTNLLSNAIKYGGADPIEIRVGAADGRARLEVADHGIGIDPADRQRIFERFARAAPSSAYGGLGLGLYIARQIVEAHGGSIEVASEPGEGATFRMELPLEAARAQQKKHAREPSDDAPRAVR